MYMGVTMSVNEKKTEYLGQGMAIGEEQGITFYGSVKAQFFENGRVVVEMDVEKQEVKQTVSVPGGLYGQFRELKVETEAGTFYSYDVTVGLKKLSLGVSSGTLLGFFPNESIFIPRIGENLKVRYWKIFLTTCVSNFKAPTPDLAAHPLSR